MDESYPDQPEMIAHMPFLEHVAARCSTVIEIGAGFGNGSTRAITRGLKRTSHWDGARFFCSVDADPDKPQIEPKVPYWVRVTGNSNHPSTVLSVRQEHQYLTGEKKLHADFIYIDSDHTWECMTAELPLWTPLADKRTVFLFHDTWMLGVYNRMTDAIKEYCAANALMWEFTDLTRASHGLGMMAHPWSDWQKVWAQYAY